MNGNAGDRLYPVIDSDQKADIFETYLLGQSAAARIISFRSSEAHTQALPCQDYARISSNLDGSSICFCVCDGVGLSYKGNFAAKYLAECLVDWLFLLTSIPRRSAKVLKILKPQLDLWASAAQAELGRSDIPQELPALVREVLEELRSLYGSETVFLCGRIDMLGPSQKRFQSHRVRSLFIWMGNVTARLFTSTGRFIELGDKQNDYNRWSTVRGSRGIIKAKILSMNAIDRLVVHTDGLDTIESELASLNDDELWMRIQHLLTLPKNDDMTILDLQWTPDIASEENEA